MAEEVSMIHGKGIVNISLGSMIKLEEYLALDFSADLNTSCNLTELFKIGAAHRSKHSCLLIGSGSLRIGDLNFEIGCEKRLFPMPSNSKFALHSLAAQTQTYHPLAYRNWFNIARVIPLTIE